MTNPLLVCLYYWLIFLSLTIICSALNEVCLLGSYVTSAKSSSVRSSNNLVTITLNLEFDYTKEISIQNLVISIAQERPIIVSPGAAYLINTRKPEINIAYRREDLISWAASKPPIPLQFTYQDYRDISKQYLEWKQFGSPLNIAADCSPMFIYEADSYVPLADNTHLRVLYHNSIRCLENVRLSSNNLFDSVTGFLQRNLLFHSNIISATFTNNILFEFTMDGYVYISHTEPVRPPDGNLVLKFTRDSTIKTRLSTGPFITERPQKDLSPIVFNEACETFASKGIYEAHKSGITRPKPFRSFFADSSSPDKYFGAISPEFQMEQYFEHFSIQRGNDPKPRFRLSELVNAPRGFTLEASANSVFGKGNIPNHWIMRKEGEELMYYNQLNSSGILCTYEYRKLILPDDITLWTTCKKVVSLYGFWYTLHNYDQNIIQDQAPWNFLEGFKWPIDAMHFDERSGEFWFFSRVFTLIRAVPKDKNNCNIIDLNIIDTAHVDLFFGHKCNGIPIGIEPGDTSQPCLEDSATIAAVPRTSFPLMLTLFIGLAVTIIVAIGLVFAFRRNGETKPRVIYSTSKSDSLRLHQNSHPISQKSPEPAFQSMKTSTDATMSKAPLLSEALGNTRTKSVASNKGRSPKTPKTPKTPKKSVKISPRKASPIKKSTVS